MDGEHRSAYAAAAFDFLKAFLVLFFALLVLFPN